MRKVGWQAVRSQIQRDGSEVATLAKNARMGHPQSWWCRQKPRVRH